MKIRVSDEIKSVCPTFVGTKDLALFVSFCIEEYGATKGMTGEQVLDLFSKYGVIEYLSKCFEPLHTQGRQWLMEEIDEFIELRKKKSV